MSNIPTIDMDTALQAVQSWSLRLTLQPYPPVLLVWALDRPLFTVLQLHSGSSVKRQLAQTEIQKMTYETKETFLYWECDWACGQAVQRGHGTSLCRDTQKLSGHVFDSLLQASLLESWPPKVPSNLCHPVIQWHDPSLGLLPTWSEDVGWTHTRPKS